MQKFMENRPIPRERETTWEAVYSMPIFDCREEVVPLSLSPERILVRSVYFEARIEGALPECYARSGVLERLIKATKLLPDHLRFVVLDAWRGENVQKILFQQCRAALAKTHPEMDEKQLFVMTEQYVARPSLNPSNPSPHSTGGAIDLMIATRDGVPLFFGSPFDCPSEISYTRHFEDKLENGVVLDENELEALQNRRMLYNIMIASGFVNYPSEWWHFEYGTQRWANATGQEIAIYGATNVSFNAFEEFGNVI